MQGSEQDARSVLLKMRDEKLRILVTMARDRKEAEAVLTEVWALEKTLHAGALPPQGKYSLHRKAIKAILAYLDDVDRGMPKEDIVTALRAGGYGGGSEGAAVDIRKSIGSYIGRGKGSITGLIKEVNGLIGRGEWPDEKFRQ